MADEVQLDPPIGTCYFKSYSYTFPISDSIGSASVTVKFYIYVTLVKPDDPDFTAKGGKVYIIAVYDGWIKTTGTSSDIFGSMAYGDDNPLPPPPNRQLPVPGTENINGDTRIYTIDFTQTMNMYNNSGNGSFTFSARYRRTYSLTGYRQAMYENTRAGWKLHREDSAGSHDETRVTYGLQVYETNKLATPRFTLYINRTYPSGAQAGRSTHFILDYSAETMARAVVG